MTSEYVKNNHDEVYRYLLERKNEYYNSTPTISDQEFDAVEDLFRQHFPADSYFSSVGISAKGVSQVKHEIPMLSCAKAKTIDDVDKWLKKINYSYQDLLVMPKVDGISCSIQYRDGKLSCISTRGDGKVGQDITWLKAYVDIPFTLPKEHTVSWCEIRGELYIPKSTTLETNGKPLRALASGLLNRKDSKEDCKYLNFIAYQYYDDVVNTFYNDYFQNTLLYLDKYLHFDTVAYFYGFKSRKEVEHVYSEYISTLRDKWVFETDGLVIQLRDMNTYKGVDSQYVVDHHHFYNIALKPQAEFCDTVLKSVYWDVSRNGNVIPVANFEPVYMGNKKIENATLNNYENVLNLNLKAGDEVRIQYSNEVLPYFEKKIKDNNGQSCLIDTCSSCGTKLHRDGVHIKCTNVHGCPEQAIKSITYWCTIAGMDNISESTIRTLYEHKLVYDYIDLYNLHDAYDTLLTIDGFGEKKVNNLLSQIEKSCTCSLSNFLCRFGIELVGEKALAKLGIKTVDDFWNFNSKEYVIGQNLIEFRNSNKKGIEELLDRMNILQEKRVESTFKGSVCMTGAGPDKRSILEAKVAEKGYEVVDSVTKNTTILVVDDLSSASSKMIKAQKLGIRIMLYEEFFK